MIYFQRGQPAAVSQPLSKPPAFPTGPAPSGPPGPRGSGLQAAAGPASLVIESHSGEPVSLNPFINDKFQVTNKKFYFYCCPKYFLDILMSRCMQFV